jgi:hypothetical protein
MTSPYAPGLARRRLGIVLAGPTGVVFNNSGGVWQRQQRKQQAVSTNFGAFYPTGYMIIAFERYDDAEQTYRDLRTGGYAEEDCDLHTTEKVAEFAQRNLDSSGLMARLGKGSSAVELRLKATRDFPARISPNDLDTERAMNVVRRRPFVLVRRYHCFAIETLNGA